MMVLAKTYLFAYNALQTAGWAYLLYLLAPHLKEALVDDKPGASKAIYQEVGQVLRIFQTAAVLEILHAAVGLVR